MKHFFLKFNHGVEIGARLAYTGHYKRTNLPKIKQIMEDELHHKQTLERMLTELGEKPNPIIDLCFYLVGNTICWLCKFMPLWSLDFVARIMELFAVFNYENLSRKYPKWSPEFKTMAEAELDHEEFFRLGPEQYHKINSSEMIPAKN